MLTPTDACRIVDVVSRITEPRQGVRPGFEEGDVLRALLETAKVPRGRLWLAKNLGLGEASARTLLKRLRREGLVTVDRVAGAELTEKGKKVVAPLLISVHVEETEAPSALKGWGRVTLIVARNLSRLVETRGVIGLRDLAVAGGASAALVAVYRNEGIVVPAVEDEDVVGELEAMVGSARIRGDRLVLVLRCGLREAYRILYRLLVELCSEA